MSGMEGMWTGARRRSWPTSGSACSCVAVSVDRPVAATASWPSAATLARLQLPSPSWDRNSRARSEASPIVTTSIGVDCAGSGAPFTDPACGAGTHRHHRGDRDRDEPHVRNTVVGAAIGRGRGAVLPTGVERADVKGAAAIPKRNRHGLQHAARARGVSQVHIRQRRLLGRNKEFRPSGLSALPKVGDVDGDGVRRRGQGVNLAGHGGLLHLRGFMPCLTDVAIGLGSAVRRGSRDVLSWMRRGRAWIRVDLRSRRSFLLWPGRFVRNMSGIDLGARRRGIVRRSG